MLFSGVWNFSRFGQIRDMTWFRQIDVWRNPILSTIRILIASQFGRVSDEVSAADQCPSRTAVYLNALRQILPQWMLVLPDNLVNMANGVVQN